MNTKVREKIHRLVDLGIDVTEETEYVVGVEYTGHVNWIELRVFKHDRYKDATTENEPYLVNSYHSLEVLDDYDEEVVTSYLDRNIKILENLLKEEKVNE